MIENTPITKFEVRNVLSPLEILNVASFINMRRHQNEDNLPRFELPEPARFDWSFDKEDGKLPVRLGKWLKVEYGLQGRTMEWLKPALGTAINQYFIPQAWYDITQDIDWYSGDFGDGDSCFMKEGGEAYVRALRAVNAYAFRIWSLYSGGTRGKRATTPDGVDVVGSARCWLLPYRMPAYDVHSGYMGEAWTMFNPYGHIVGEGKSVTFHNNLLHQVVKAIWPEMKTRENYLYNSASHLYVNGPAVVFGKGELPDGELYLIAKGERDVRANW